MGTRRYGTGGKSVGRGPDQGKKGGGQDAILLGLYRTVMDDKLLRLKDILENMGSVLIAYSGGVDSTFLLKVSKDTLGEKVLASTAISPTYPEREVKGAERIARELEVRHIIIESNELHIKGFSENPPNRCYFCKKELFSKLKELSQKEGLAFVADGSNKDDEGDFRPGMEAAKELGIRSPLREAGLTKDEIRTLSRNLGLTTADRPSFACLASRFPYGEPITRRSLNMIERAEEFFLKEGFSQIRVRHHHKGIARIEVEQGDLERFLDPLFRKQVIEELKEVGYTYISLDLEGYRSGSLNESLSEGEWKVLKK